MKMEIAAYMFICSFLLYAGSSVITKSYAVEFVNNELVFHSTGLKPEKEDIELPLFDLITISTATNNFSNNHKIGEGGFGHVYKVRYIISVLQLRKQ